MAEHQNCLWSSLKIPIPRLHSTKLWSQERKSRLQYVFKFPRWFQCVTKFENQWFTIFNLHFLLMITKNILMCFENITQKGLLCVILGIVMYIYSSISSWYLKTTTSYFFFVFSLPFCINFMSNCLGEAWGRTASPMKQSAWDRSYNLSYKLYLAL